MTFSANVPEAIGALGDIYLPSGRGTYGAPARQPVCGPGVTAPVPPLA